VLARDWPGRVWSLRDADGLRHPQASERQLNAVVCALTVQMGREGRTRAVGDPAEGLVVIPDSP
jgi:hypothetical protein